MRSSSARPTLPPPWAIAAIPATREVRKAIFGAIARLKAIGKPAGILTLNEDFARECIAAGTTFTAVAVDAALLVREADAVARRFGVGVDKG